jgi:Flp pilus assembly protein TadD
VQPEVVPPVQRATTSRPHQRTPAAAERLRLPLHQRSQERMRARWGFDLNAPDAPARADSLLAAAPGDAERLVLAAAVRASRGDDLAALGSAQQAVAADASSARAHATLAALLARTGDSDGAMAHARRAADLDPLDPAALYNLGLARWSAGDRREARQDLDRAADLLGLPRASWWRPRRP